MPPGTSALLISENRLRALLAKVPWLLFQELVLSCGEEGPGLRPLQGSAARGLHGEAGTASLTLSPVDRNYSLPGDHRGSYPGVYH